MQIFSLRTVLIVGDGARTIGKEVRPARDDWMAGLTKMSHYYGRVVGGSEKAIEPSISDDAADSMYSCKIYPCAMRTSVECWQP